MTCRRLLASDTLTGINNTRPTSLNSELTGTTAVPVEPSISTAPRNADCDLFGRFNQALTQLNQQSLLPRLPSSMAWNRLQIIQVSQLPKSIGTLRRLLELLQQANQLILSALQNSINSNYGSIYSALIAQFRSTCPLVCSDYSVLNVNQCLSTDSYGSVTNALAIVRIAQFNHSQIEKIVIHFAKSEENTQTLLRRLDALPLTVISSLQQQITEHWINDVTSTLRSCCPSRSFLVASHAPQTSTVAPVDSPKSVPNGTCTLVDDIPRRVDHFGQNTVKEWLDPVIEQYGQSIQAIFNRTTTDDQRTAEFRDLNARLLPQIKHEVTNRSKRDLLPNINDRFSITINSCFVDCGLNQTAALLATCAIFDQQKFVDSLMSEYDNLFDQLQIYNAKITDRLMAIGAKEVQKQSVNSYKSICSATVVQHFVTRSKQQVELFLSRAFESCCQPKSTDLSPSI